jgi:ABC-2 type transport system permease protein
VVQFAGMMVMMPFMFISSAFAPIETMPAWMEALAALNPVAHAADALRANVLGTAAAGDTLAALAAAATLWIVVSVRPARHRPGGGRSAAQRTGPAVG